MRELSLHILDIVQNSLAVGASLITIHIHESLAKNCLRIEIIDNGKGIEPDQLQQVVDPFYTTRSSRKIGLGLSLFQAAAEHCGGDFSIRSQPGQGTTVVATFGYDHIDRAPLGNITDTILTLVISNPAVDFCYRHRFEDRVFTFDTREFSKHIPRSELTMPIFFAKVREYLSNGIHKLNLKSED